VHPSTIPPHWSRAHRGYVGLEIVTVIALLIVGVLLVAT
jgi:hypothetical protein